MEAEIMSTRRPPLPNDSAVSTRLFAVEEDVRELKRQIGDGFHDLNAKFDARARTPWPALSLSLGLIVAVGGLVYWPIRERQVEMRQDLETKFNEARRITEDASREGLDRDRRFLDMIIRVKEDLSRLEGGRGRNRDQ